MEINLSPSAATRGWPSCILSIFQSITGMSWFEYFSLFPRHNLYADHPLNVYHVQKIRIWLGSSLLRMPDTYHSWNYGASIPCTVALGLFFLPLCIFVTFNYQTLCRILWFYYCYFLDGNACTLGYFSGYRPRPIIILSLKGNFKHGIMVALALTLPFLLTLPWMAQKRFYQLQNRFVASMVESNRKGRVNASATIIPCLSFPSGLK